MEAALTSAPQTPAEAAPESARRCLVTGEMLPKDELIRFVVGPDRSIVPDLAENLPGRGLWVKADHDVIDQATKKGLFARAAKDSVQADPQLAGLAARLLRRRCLDYLGLAKRSGNAVLGQTQVEAELKAGRLALLVVAEDAKEELAAGGLFASRSFNRSELGAALGYDQSVYIGLKPHKLTEKLKTELIRLEKITGKAHITKANG